MTPFRKVLAVREAFRATFHRGFWRKDDGKTSEHTREVFEALRRFCNADTSCVKFDKENRIDALATVKAEGRREVFIEICRVLNLSDVEIFALQQREDMTND